MVVKVGGPVFIDAPVGTLYSTVQVGFAAWKEFR
jgi:hypothetical protein